MRRAPLVVAALLAVAAPLTLPHGASGSGSVTVGAGGAAPASGSFTGGPLTGTGDGGGLATPPAQCSAATACDTTALTLAAPGGWTSGHDIGLTITVTWDPGAASAGLDTFLLDSQGNVVGQNTASVTPSVVRAAHLQPGAYTIEVTGDVGVATTYTGSVVVSSTVVTAAATTLPSDITFAPSTVVSPTVLGAEPQVSFERPVAGTQPGAIDPSRGFIDWPLSSRTNTGTLWRTVNGGDSWRMLYDPACAQRQRPNCFTGGGGDTVNRVNLADGALLFGDQESLAAEAFAQSNDHGDSFPAQQQTPVTAAGTGVDRQWISAVSARGHMAGPADSFELEGVFSYHIPIAGIYVSGIDRNGLVHPAVATQITQVDQSGDSQVDTTGGKGDGWFWQAYRWVPVAGGGAAGYFVATAPLSQIESPAGYHVTNVTSDVPQVFPWLALDNRGNAYAVWTAPDGQLYMSYSLIADRANDPTRGGVPGTSWSHKVQVNPAPLGATVFPEVVAGDPGHIAIAYDATADYKGVSDGAPASTRWVTVVSMTSDAFDPAPTWQTGTVSHRLIHVGSVCTSGTTCIATGGDRSLLDMINVAMDADGRVGVVYTNNDNTFARQEVSQGSEGNPYVMFAKLAHGPSLLSGHAPFAVDYPTAYRSSAAGDATWPNHLGATNIPGLDVLGDGVYVDGSDLVARIDLADASVAGMTGALSAYNAAVTTTDLPAQRVQYVARFDSGHDVWYLALDQDGSGNRRAYGGKVTSANAISNGTSALGTTYDPQAGFAVSYSVVGNSLFLRAPLALFGVSAGTTLYSYSAFSQAGPSDASLGAVNGDALIVNLVRTVDAAPPMDAVLQSAAHQPAVGGPGCPSGCGVPLARTALVNTAAGGGGAGAAVVALPALLTAAGLAGRRRQRRTP